MKASSARSYSTATTVPLATKERIYVFNVSGGLVGEYASLEACAAKLDLKVPNLRAALRRGSLTGGRYYLATAATFKPTQHNLCQNPLALNHHGAHHRTMGGLEADFSRPF